MDQTLYNLLIQDAQFLYGAETEQANSLRDLGENIASPELSAIMAEHAEETTEQVRRLEQILSSVGEEPSSEVPAAVQGMIEDAQMIADQELGAEVRDIALAASARKMEHYEMACYEGALAIAEQLGLQEIIDPLRRTLEEERRADQRIAAACTTLIQAQVPRETQPAATAD